MRGRERIRRWLLVAIGALYVLSIPWYRSEPGEGGSLDLWFGVPDWVALALGCYVAVAVLNCAAWFLTEIPDEAPAGPEGPSGRSRESDRPPIQ